MANASGQPEGSGGAAAKEVTAARAGPPQRKQAATTMTNANVFIAAVASCVPLPHLIPRHCKTKKPIMKITAISLAGHGIAGRECAFYERITQVSRSGRP